MTRSARYASLTLVAALAAAPTAQAQDTKGATAARSKAAIAAPSKLWAAQTAPGEVTLVWGAVPNAIAYELFVRDAKGGLVRLGRVTGAVTRFVVSASRLGAVSGGVLEFVVQAFDQNRVGGVAGHFNRIRLSKQANPKGALAPQNVDARETAPGVVTVTWTEIPAATAYGIGRSAGTGGFQRLCELCPTGGSYVDTVPATGVAYTYTIVGITPGGATRRTASTPVTPTGVVAVAGDAGDDSKSAVAAASISVQRETAGPDGAFSGAAIRILVNLVVDVAEGMTASLMRQVCDGAWQVVARYESTPKSAYRDVVPGALLAQCGGKAAVPVRYKARIGGSKSRVAETEVATIHVPVPARAEAGSAPANPKGRNP